MTTTTPNPVEPLVNEFLHLMNRKQLVETWNFSISGKFISANFSSPAVYGDQALVDGPREISIQTLRSSPPGGFIASPRMRRTILAASALRRGADYSEGAIMNTVGMSLDQKRKTIQLADAELLFEKARRAVAATAASRLCCLYLVENNEIGEDILNAMFGRARDDAFRLEVKIDAAQRLSRCDWRWFNHYLESGDEDAPLNYWQGNAYEGDQQWEYLLEGQASLADDDAFQELRLSRRPLGAPAKDAELLQIAYRIADKKRNLGQ